MLVFAAAEFKKRGGHGRRGMHFRPFRVRHPTISRHPTNWAGGQGQTRPTTTRNRSRWEMSQQRCFGLAPCLPLDLWMASNATGHRSESRIGHDWSRRGEVRNSALGAEIASDQDWGFVLV